MKTRLLCLVIGVLLLPLTTSAQENKDAAVREFPVAGLRIAHRSNGDVTKPTAIKSAEELVKAISDPESQAVIKKHVDFTKQQILFFYWFGSKADRGNKGDRSIFLTGLAAGTRDSGHAASRVRTNKWTCPLFLPLSRV